jgi:hypothetical protein
MVFPSPEGVSSTALRKRWWANKKLKLLPDGAAVALLQAHDRYVYAPLKVGLYKLRCTITFLCHAASEAKRSSRGVREQWLDDVFSIFL